MQQQHQDHDVGIADAPLPGPDVLILGTPDSVRVIEAAAESDDPILILEPDWILSEPPTLAMTIGTAVVTGAAIGMIALCVRRLTHRRHVRRVTIIE